MPKKKKLNSKNPKYMTKSQRKEKIIKKQELACIIYDKIKVYKVWYE